MKGPLLVEGVALARRHVGGHRAWGHHHRHGDGDARDGVAGAVVAQSFGIFAAATLRIRRDSG